MKKLFFIIGFVISGTLFANAQSELAQLTSKYSLLATESNMYYSNIVVNNRWTFDEKKFQKFKRMRTAGIILTAVGSGVTIAGISVINSTKKHNYTKHQSDSNFENTVNYAGGVILTCVGVSMIGGGVTMWTIGNSKMKKYGRDISLNTNENGLSLSFNF